MLEPASVCRIHKDENLCAMAAPASSNLDNDVVGMNYVSLEPVLLQNNPRHDVCDFALHGPPQLSYMCGVCQQSFQNNVELQAHLGSHADLMPFLCSVCQAAFFDSEDLVQHVESEHTLHRPYACGVCCVMFARRRKLENHMTSTHRGQVKGESRITGVEEPRIQRSKRKCALALDDVYKGKCSRLENGDTVDEDDDNDTDHDFEANTYKESMLYDAKNNVDTVVVGSSTSLQRRKREPSENIQDVDFESSCTKVTRPSRGKRVKHLYSCNFCGKICPNRCQMAVHVRIHTDSKPYECSLCSLRFRQYGNLKGHMQRHTQKRDFVCDRCAKAFWRSTHLAEHIRLCHSEDKLFRCTKCPETFSGKEDYLKHKQEHKKMPKYECGVCQKKFFDSYDFKRHTLVHTKEKKFECEICHLTSAHLGNLKKHMKIHTEEKSLKCDVCESKFRFNADLERHKKTHLKKNPYPCQYCPKLFSSRKKLKAHFDLHQMSKAQSENTLKHRCQTCNMKFRLKRELCHHLKTHLEEPSNLKLQRNLNDCASA